jgi:hypothetical protein
MKSMKKDFQTVTRGLKALAKRTEQISKKVDKLEKAKAAPKRTVKAKATTKSAHLKKKAAKKSPAKKKAVVRKTKATKLTATGKVLTIVKRFRKGINVPALAKKTRFKDKKVRDIIFKAFAQGKIRRVGRGLYAAA